MRVISWNVQGLKSPPERDENPMASLPSKKRHSPFTVQEANLKEEDFYRMRKLWIGEVIGSPSQGRKAGVLILLNKRLHYTLKDTKTDRDGRLISTRFDTNLFDMTITNIYASNPQPNNIFKAF